MKILNLKLQNFMGIKNLELKFNGQDANVYGTNAAGKTTCFSAFTWLLFNKDSQNRSDFEIKTLGSDGEPEHGLEHMVEAILELEDGSRLALKKVYMEKWQKKRGSATAEFTGHTTDHFIDGVPVKKKEYDETISDIADENIFRLLTDPAYFNQQLHWQKRRELLLEVCGDVSDKEVIASKTELVKLTDILGNRTIEQHRKVIQARRSEINRELEKIPVRIDEVKRGLPDISDITNEKELPNDIAKLRKQLRAKQEELAQARAGGQVAEKTKELMEIEAQVMDLRNKHHQELGARVSDLRTELTSIQNEIGQARSDISNTNYTISITESNIRQLNKQMQELRTEWHDINEQAFSFEQDAVCPTCGQDLPADKLEAAREHALEDFNLRKAKQLKRINSDGAKLKERRDYQLGLLDEYKKKLEGLKPALEAREEREAELKERISAILQGSQPVESTPEYYQLYAKQRDLQDEIRKLEADNSIAVTAIQKEIDTLTDAIQALEQAQARLETRGSGLKRIEDLKAEERKLAAEYEDLESQLYLTEEFIRAKVRLLEEKINSKFEMARFKLFDVQVNGALSETCETTFNGVPYSNLNNGARLNIGLDIINTLSEHYNFAPPVWLDNAESVTDILPTKGQQIRLIVSAADKKLRVELAEKKEMKEAV